MALVELGPRFRISAHGPWWHSWLFGAEGGWKELAFRIGPWEVSGSWNRWTPREDITEEQRQRDHERSLRSFEALESGYADENREWRQRQIVELEEALRAARAALARAEAAQRREKVSADAAGD